MGRVDSPVEEHGDGPVERLPQPGGRELAGEILFGEQALAHGLPDAFRQARPVLGDRALELEVPHPPGLVGVEQHPDRHGIRDSAREGADADRNEGLQPDRFSHAPNN